MREGASRSRSFVTSRTYGRIDGWWFLESRGRPKRPLREGVMNRGGKLEAGQDGSGGGVVAEGLA